MRLPSIAERLGERFVRPLEIDRLCALVRPAVEEIRGGGEPQSFRQLEEHIARFTQEPAGAGFELPGWLQALEEEMAGTPWRAEERPEDECFDPLIRLPQVRLSRPEVDRQVQRMFEDGEKWMLEGS